MPTIASRRRSSHVSSAGDKSGNVPVNAEKSSPDLTPQKRKLRSNSASKDSPDSLVLSPVDYSPAKLKSPRRRFNDSPRTDATQKENEKNFGNKVVTPIKSPVKKKLLDSFCDKPIWNPRDMEQLSLVKEALHVSASPSAIVCRDNEQNRVLGFLKKCVEEEKGGSLYVCGCPGTGKSLSMEKIKEALVGWAKEAGFQPPDVLSVNCTSLTNTSEIFSKILGKGSTEKKLTGSNSPLKNLQTSYFRKEHFSGMKLVIADELDYLITRDRAVLHDLFMLTTFPYSRCILIGIANAIDLADRFLPKLQSLNCKPLLITYQAYSKDQIIIILQQRLMALPYITFQPQALELCAAKVAAVSGDMRKALWICRSAIEILEAEMRDSTGNLDQSSASAGLSDIQRAGHWKALPKQDTSIVRLDHMALALSKAYGSPVIDTIQSLPQHQQIILCSAVKLFRGRKKDSTIGELNKYYIEVCKSNLIPSVAMVEFSSICIVLKDQGLLKLGQSREDKLKRVSLKVDEADIIFALQGIRIFKTILQQ